jgi:hypothetical protein
MECAIEHRARPVRPFDDHVRVVGRRSSTLADGEVDGGDQVAEALELRRDELPAPGSEIRAMDQDEVHAVFPRSRPCPERLGASPTGRDRQAMTRPMRAAVHEASIGISSTGRSP